MNKFNINAIAVVLGLTFSVGAMAQTMSRDQYKFGKKGITAEYKVATAACGSLSGNAKDICKAEARGKEKVARAELKTKYKPSEDASYKLRVVRADADYAVARQRCDDKAGNVKDVCVKEARATAVSDRADAKAQMKTADARKDAASEKRDANYALAKEKCDALAGDAKGNCIKEATARFGKP